MIEKVRIRILNIACHSQFTSHVKFIEYEMKMISRVTKRCEWWMIMSHNCHHKIVTNFGHIFVTKKSVTIWRHQNVTIS